jgi:Right handed beta helix region/Pectate lyase superfamily protein
MSLAVLTPSGGDDTAAIQAALETGGDVRLSAGAYTISGPLSLRANGQRLGGDGVDLTTLNARGDFSVCVAASGLDGVSVQDMTIVAGGARVGVSTRTLGVFLVSCSRSRVSGIKVIGTVGGPVAPNGAIMPGVAIAIGYGTACMVTGCTAQDCGGAAPGQTSDGFYTSGSFNVIADCAVNHCTDTAFVVEDSQYSGVVRSTATGCGCGLAITCAGNADARGNYADQVTITDWDSPVTGGIAVGCPVPTTSGHLRQTTVTDCTIVWKARGGGPAVNVRTTGPGSVVGLTLRGLMVQGAATQGILLGANAAELVQCVVTDTEWTGIQLQGGCGDVTVRGCRVTNAKQFGLTVLGPTSAVLLEGNDIQAPPGRMSWGIYLFDAADGVTQENNSVKGAALGPFGRGAITPLGGKLGGRRGARR